MKRFERVYTQRNLMGAQRCTHGAVRRLEDRVELKQN